MADEPASGLGFQALGRASLRDRAYGELRAALLAGRFPPGQKMTIRALAGAFAISPTPVREALGRLHAERVLDLLPNGSAVIPVMTRTRFEELAGVRAIVEGAAAEQATARATTADLNDILAVLGRLLMAHQKGDTETYLERHRDFHFHIYRCAGNALLCEMIESLWMQAGPVLSYVAPEYVMTRPGSPPHERIFQDLRRRDGAAVRQAIASDIAAAAAFIASLADEDGLIRRADRAPMPRS